MMTEPGKINKTVTQPDL